MPETAIVSSVGSGISQAIPVPQPKFNLPSQFQRAFLENLQSCPLFRNGQPWRDEEFSIVAAVYDMVQTKGKTTDAALIGVAEFLGRTVHSIRFQCSNFGHWDGRERAKGHTHCSNNWKAGKISARSRQNRATLTRLAGDRSKFLTEELPLAIAKFSFYTNVLADMVDKANKIGEIAMAAATKHDVLADSGRVAEKDVGEMRLAAATAALEG